VLSVCVFSFDEPSSLLMKDRMTKGGENMKRLLIPLFGVALVAAAALVAAPKKAETCEPCNPADCCPEAQNCCPTK
jgi:hypothetical protein